MYQIQRQIENAFGKSRRIRFQNTEVGKITASAGMFPKDHIAPMHQFQSNQEMMQPKSNNENFASKNITNQISSLKGSGKSLPNHTSQYMSNAFGTDFSDIKIHTGSEAAELNEHLGSRAFAYGKDIYFNKGEFNPDSGKGKHLLAHELTHVVQQNNVISPMIQRDGDSESGNSDTPLADLVAGVLRDQLSNSSMQGHLRSLGTALQGLAVENTSETGDQPASSAERLSALGVARAFEITSAAILRDPGFARLRQRIIEIVGSSDEVALIAAVAAALGAVLADVPLRASPSRNLGAGFSVGGSFDLGSIQSLQFNNLSLYAQYARDHFRTRLTGAVTRDSETDEFSGSGSGEIRLGNNISHLLGRVTINSDGELVLAGRLSSGYTFGGSDRLIFTTDVSHSFATGETIVRPGISGRFNLGNDQNLRLGSELVYSSESGVTGLTGFIEYRTDRLQLRIEGNMNGLGESTGIMPGGDMRIQGTLTIPLW